jgi:DNA-binding protein H-NS
MVMDRKIMAAINVDKMSFKELVALQARLDKAIAEARQRERSEIKEKISELAANSGFSVAELFGTGRGLKGSKVAPKYINPDNESETWTGRGRQPRWLVAKLAKGAKLEQFKI